MPALLYAPLPSCVGAAEIRAGRYGRRTALPGTASTGAPPEGTALLRSNNPAKASSRFSSSLHAIVTPFCPFGDDARASNGRFLPCGGAKRWRAGPVAQLTSLVQNSAVSLASLDTQLRTSASAIKWRAPRTASRSSPGTIAQKHDAKPRERARADLGRVLLSGIPALDRELHAALPTRRGSSGTG
jgi:hypothetical protein